MRFCPILLLCAVATAATTVDQRIDDLTRRIRNLASRETLSCRVHTLLETAAVLQAARPELAAEFRESGFKVLREHPEITATVALVDNAMSVTPETAETSLVGAENKAALYSALPQYWTGEPLERVNILTDAAAAVQVRLRESRPRTAPVTDELNSTRRALVAAVREKASEEKIKPLAEAFLRAIEHGEEHPNDYTLLARVTSQYALSTGGDNPSVRTRILLAEAADLVNTEYDFALPMLDTRVVSLKEQRGKVVLLNFWATWCEPCRAEMPLFERLWQERKDRGLVVLAVSDEPPGVVRAFVEKSGFTFPVLIDSERKVFDHYRVSGLPATKIIDATGRMRAEVNAIREDELRSVLKDAGLP